MNNVNLDSLKRTHGDDAEKVFIKVREMGGFGDVEPNNPGGLDISGLSDSKKESILKYLESSKPSDEQAELLKLSKAKLVALAEKEGAKVTPDSMTNEQIVSTVLANRK